MRFVEKRILLCSEHSNYLGIFCYPPDILCINDILVMLASSKNIMEHLYNILDGRIVPVNGRF